MQTPDPQAPNARPLTPHPTLPDPDPRTAAAAEAAHRAAALEGLALMYAYYEAEAA